MKAKRFLLILLAALLVFPTGCSNSTSEETTPSDNAASVESTADESTAEAETEAAVDANDPRANAKDSLPADLKFDGETVTVLHRGGDTGATLEIVAEEDTGDVVVSAVYNRNLIVEDRLGIEIASIPTADTIHQGGTVAGQVRTAVQAGTKDFDIFANHMSQSTPLILEGMCLNLYNNPYIDWDQAWWNQSFNNELKIADKLYFAVGELSQTMIRGTYVMYVNKDLYANHFHDEDI